MTQDRRTKAQILAELNEKSAKLDDALGEMSKLREATRVSAPARVAVADAVAGCVRALDPIAGRQSYSMDAKSDVKHVLAMLCDRYGVLRVEKVTEPCNRTHIENLTAQDVVEVLKRDPGLGF